MGDHVNRSKVQVCFLPLGVGPHDVQDMKAVFEIFLGALSKSEIDSGRFGEMPVPASSSAVVTHVDRIFGCFQQTRKRCSVCVDSWRNKLYCPSQRF